jgi:uroporphyrin-3 C-methyltransferase
MSVDKDPLIDIAPIIINKSKSNDDQAFAVRSSSGLAKFSFFITLLLSLFVAYLVWYAYGQQQDYTAANGNLINENRSLQSSIDLAEQSRIASSKRIDDQQRALQALQSAFAENKMVVEGQGRRLLSLTATTTDDWRIAEVEYLLQLANQRLLTSKDVTTALQLLLAADKILTELGDPRLFSIREAIAEDRAALTLIGDQDLEGVFLRLSATANQIDGLPLLDIPSFIDDTHMEATQSKITEEQNIAQEKQSLQQKLSAIAEKTLRELKSLVVIQQREVSVKPLLPPEQKTYLRANLKLLLNQAQLALLGGTQVLYQNSLLRAKAVVNEYFPNDQVAVQGFVRELDDLSKITVELDLPDVHGSILAIKAHINDLHRLEKSGSTPAQSAPVVRSSIESAGQSDGEQQEAAL